MATLKKTSLFQRLGGIPAIAAVAGGLVDQVLDDPRLSSNPQLREAHRNLSAAGLKYLWTELLATAAGRPQTYAVLSVRDSLLKLTSGERDALLAHLRTAMERGGVRPIEQRELRAVAADLLDEVVMEEAPVYYAVAS